MPPPMAGAFCYNRGLSSERTMRIIEIADNPNCEATERVFHDVEPPQPVSLVRLSRDGEAEAWYEIIGWTALGGACPALAQKVDDSGAGVSYLVFGGDAGLRLRPAGVQRPWSVTDAAQWGEPFLLLAEAHDIRESNG